MDIWAQKEDGKFVTIQFSKAVGEPDTYTPLEPSGPMARALQESIDDKEAMVDLDQIELSDGTRVYPIVMGEEAVTIRQKQRAFLQRDTRDFHN